MRPRLSFWANFPKQKHNYEYFFKNVRKISKLTPEGIEHELCELAGGGILLHFGALQLNPFPLEVVLQELVLLLLAFGVRRPARGFSLQLEEAVDEAGEEPSVRIVAVVLGKSVKVVDFEHFQHLK